MKKLISFLLPLIIAVFSLSTDCFAVAFTREAIKFNAKSLMNRMEITRDVSYELKNRLSVALKDPALSETIDKRGVGAVFAYACNEGGIVVKYMEGNGLISFIDGRQAAPISITSWGIGAIIGGSAQWGIGLIIGPIDEKNFGGRYKGGLRIATAWEASTRDLLYLSRSEGNDTQEIYIVITARGLSAGVGGVIVNIAPAW